MESRIRWRWLSRTASRESPCLPDGSWPSWRPWRAASEPRWPLPALGSGGGWGLGIEAIEVDAIVYNPHIRAPSMNNCVHARFWLGKTSTSRPTHPGSLATVPNWRPGMGRLGLRRLGPIPRLAALLGAYAKGNRAGR